VICIIGHDVSICKSYVLFLAAQRKGKVRIDYAKELCRLWRPDLFVLQEYENGLGTWNREERRSRKERKSGEGLKTGQIHEEGSQRDFPFVPVDLPWIYSSSLYFLF
jgi:hypothetical protein